jgi:hypothetical protein
MAQNQQLSLFGQYLTVNSSSNVVSINTASVNAASHTVGITFTANATLVNATAINITGQTNTSTLYVTTSANVGTYFTVNSSAAVEAVNASFTGANLSIGGTNTYITSNTLITGTLTSAANVILNNNNNIIFKTISGANVSFVQQNDDNFVFYSTNTAGGQRAVFSIYANSITSNLNFAVRTNHAGGLGIPGGQTLLDSTGSQGTVGQVLTSNGTGNVYWSTVTSGSSYTFSTGLTNTSGTITVNASYIATIASNSATYANASVSNTFTVGTAAYFVANGNMGIGTSSPAQKLEVYNSTTNAGRIRITGTGTTSGNFRGFELANSSGFTGGFFQDESSNDLTFWTSAERLRITSAGNVNITTGSLNIFGNTIANYTEFANAFINSGSAQTISSNTNVVRYTLTANCVLTLPLGSGVTVTNSLRNIVVFVKQDATGARTLSFANQAGDTVLYNNSLTFPPPNTTANKVTIYTCQRYDGDTNWYISMSFIGA